MAPHNSSHDRSPGGPHHLPETPGSRAIAVVRLGITEGIPKDTTEMWNHTKQTCPLRFCWNSCRRMHTWQHCPRSCENQRVFPCLNPAKPSGPCQLVWEISFSICLTIRSAPVWGGKYGVFAKRGGFISESHKSPGGLQSRCEIQDAPHVSWSWAGFTRHETLDAHSLSLRQDL